MPDKTRTLCIVDMQTEFPTHKPVIKQVLHEIRLAKKRNAAVIVLEYDDSGPTIEPIKKALENYGRVAYVTKMQDGGGEEFFDTAESYGFNYNKVRMVGVNRSYCVFSTAREMVKDNGIDSRIDVDLEIAIDATWCEEPRAGRQELKNLLKEHGGRFVRTRVSA